MRKQDISYQDKYNELYLDVTHPNNKDKVYIFVEGDSDIRLFRKIFHPNNCKIESIPGGNQKVEDATRDIGEKYPLVFGIRDADFLNLAEDKYAQENIFLTDTHDIEMFQIASHRVFATILQEFTYALPDEHSGIKKNLLEILDELSYLKWVNAIEDYEFSFRNVGYHDLISLEQMKFDISKYFERLMSKSLNAKIRDFAIVSKKIDELRNREPDRLNLCNGHDFLKILVQFINKLNVRKTNECEIESALRIAFTIEDWKESKTYLDTKNWASERGCQIYIHS